MNIRLFIRTYFTKSFGSGLIYKVLDSYISFIDTYYYRCIVFEQPPQTDIPIHDEVIIILNSISFTTERLSEACLIHDRHRGLIMYRIKQIKLKVSQTQPVQTNTGLTSVFDGSIVAVNQARHILVKNAAEANCILSGANQAQPASPCITINTTVSKRKTVLGV